MGALSIGVGLQIEKRNGYITKLRHTKFGRYYLANSKSILFTEMLVLMIMASLIKVFSINSNQFDVIGGLVVGQLILVMLVASKSANQG